MVEEALGAKKNNIADGEDTGEIAPEIGKEEDFEDDAQVEGGKNASK